MSQPKAAPTSPQANLSLPLVIALSLVLVVGGVWFFSPYLGAICLSAIMAYLFLPMYKWIARHMPMTAAAWTTLFVSVLIVIIPLLYVVVMIIGQGVNAVNALSHLDTSPNSQLAQTITKVSQIGSSLGLPINPGDIASSSGITGFIKNTLPGILNTGLNALVQVAVNAPAFFASVLIYACSFTALLRYHKQIVQYLLDISPFANQTTWLYLRKSGLIVTASMKGQLIIALITATMSAALLALIGYQSYFLLFVTVFTVLGMIPLGSGIVVIPICLLTMLTGNFWPGLIALLFYLIVICSIDNILRPRFIPKEAELVPVLTIIATFCGLYFFGIMGIVYGPLITIILSTTATILIEYNRANRQKQAPPVKKQATR